jgi:hypothetical protein
VRALVRRVGRKLRAGAEDTRERGPVPFGGPADPQTEALTWLTLVYVLLVVGWWIACK